LSLLSNLDFCRVQSPAARPTPCSGGPGCLSLGHYLQPVQQGRSCQ
jgi:hypothetical protein